MVSDCLGFRMLSSQLVLLIGQAAQEQSPPIIDFDGTILVQFFLFLLMYYVLKHFVFSPYLKMRTKRERAILGTQKEAEQLAEEARVLSTDYNQMLAKTRTDIERERLQLFSAHQAEAQERIQAAEQTIAAHIAQAQSRIQTEMAQTKQVLQSQIQTLGHSIAAKILGREVSE